MEQWRVKLSRGETEAAWDLFIRRYRRLIFAAIRRTVGDEDVFDVFAYVCKGLSADDLVRLRRYSDEHERRARFSTWLVAVVRNLTIDWLRRRHGRRRLTPPASLSPLQLEIFEHVFADRRSHVEAYELLRMGVFPDLSFQGYLEALTTTYRLVEGSSGKGVMRYFTGPPPFDERIAPGVEKTLATTEAREFLAMALESLPVDERLAIQLFVVDGQSAADVARVVRWPNAKAVYNRVYRALATLRERLEEEGLGPTDL